MAARPVAASQMTAAADASDSEPLVSSGQTADLAAALAVDQLLDTSSTRADAEPVDGRPFAGARGRATRTSSWAGACGGGGLRRSGWRRTQVLQEFRGRRVLRHLFGKLPVDRNQATLGGWRKLVETADRAGC